MKIGTLITVLLLAFQATVIAQEVKGRFASLPNQPIYLHGFVDFRAYVIDSTTTDEAGHFSLNFSASDYGMGYLKSIDNKPYILVLANEDTEIQGEAPSYTETIKITKGTQNQLFVQYATEHPRREQALSAWLFLEKIYATDSLFSVNKISQKAIAAEKARLKQEDGDFINKLPHDSYLRWFLPIRKLVSSVSVVAQYRPEEIAATRSALRQIDYADPRLYKSGLLKEAIENHVWFIENSSGPLDSVYAHLNLSIDMMVETLLFNEEKFNLATDFLFNLLEKRSLFTSSEYLALKILNQGSCTLSDDLARQLEGYCKMKKGNIAPDIALGEFTYFPQGVNARQLSELASDYMVVVFAAGWCGHCLEELPKLASLYDEKWKSLGLEVLMVSLDETPEEFARFAAPFPFISTTDYKKWESKAVKDYHVFGTPTMFLLNNKREIILRPKSVAHMDTWVDWVLVNGMNE
jgi:thiol-disulfide isomerase/thioredoxin